MAKNPPVFDDAKNDPKDTDTRRTAAGAGDDGEIQFFEGTITKVNADGETVLSDHLAPGETLRRETTDRYAAVKPAQAKETKPKTDESN